MGEHRGSPIERILHRIEERLEDWRKREAALQAEADASRSRLWAEAAERERLLAEAVGAEEARRESIEELTKHHRVVFVLHRTEVEETLQDFVREGDRLVSVVPRRGAPQGGRNDKRGPQGLVAGLRVPRLRNAEEPSYVRTWSRAPRILEVSDLL
jgi:hypothetical protein